MFWPSIGAPWKSYPTVISRFGTQPGGDPSGETGSRGASADTWQAETCQVSMVDLEQTSGLPLWLDPQSETLVLAQPLLELRADPQPRRLLEGVLFDPAAPGPEVPCTMYRDVALATDEGVFDEHGVRHDLLVLSEGRIGREYVKTRGHVASCAEAAQCPEVFGVLHGHALFLAQQPAGEPGRPACWSEVRDVRWIEAQPGQKVVVPADYGVVVINLGGGPLALSHLVAADAWPVHLVYQQLGGAAYYVVERDGAPAAEPNPRYREPLPPIRKEAPLEAPDLGVEEGAPLYSAFVHGPQRFAWLRQGAPAMVEVC